MDVVVVGSCMNDLVSFVPRLPQPGETIHGDRFISGFGGKGANQCVAASRLGAKTAMIAKVGDDTFGHSILDNFKTNNVNIEHTAAIKEASTGIASINVDETGQNSIVIVSGANLLLSGGDVTAAEDVVKSCKVLVTQLEISSVAALSALKLARKHSVTTILNPAPAQANIDPELYKLSDIFCPNETEAEILTGFPVTCVADARRATDVLLDRGCKTVIITLGEQGSVYATQDNRQPQHIAARQVKPVDTTGAGDAFVGSLAYYLACHPHLKLSEAIQRSGEIATLSVLESGAQGGLPWRDRLQPHLLQ